MSSYVAGNRLRTHMASGPFGAGGSVADASGLIAIAHGFPADGPTMYGVTLATSDVGGVVQTNRTALCRLSGLFVVTRIISVLGTSAAGATAAGIWWAKM